MSDYISREKVISLIEKGMVTESSYVAKIFNKVLETLIETVRIVHAEDVVEVIRCKDCRWYEIAQLKADGTADKRYKPSYCFLSDCYRPKNYYCASAWRRDNE